MTSMALCDCNYQNPSADTVDRENWQSILVVVLRHITPLNVIVQMAYWPLKKLVSLLKHCSC